MPRKSVVDNNPYQTRVGIEGDISGYGNTCQCVATERCENGVMSYAA